MTVFERLSAFIMTSIISAITTVTIAHGYKSDSLQNKSDFVWPQDKQMAISLTLDDARLSQTDKGIPLLDRHSVKATFYISPGNMQQRIEAWKKAIANGHEIGNHSVLHQCSGNFDWSKQNALEDYTLEKLRTELDSANRLIKNISALQKSKRRNAFQLFLFDD